MKKKLLSILLVLVLCIGMIPSTVSAASAVNVSSSSKTYYYTLKNVGTGKYLNVSCNSSANNTNINVWAKDGTSGENFAFYTDSKNNAYVIVPECSTSRAVNIYGSSAGANKNVCTWTKTGDSTQGWVLKAVSGGYIIQSANNKNYVLTATGSSNGSNVNIQKYSSSNKNQIWTLTQAKTVTAKTTTTGSSTITDKIKDKMTTTYSSALSSFQQSPSGKGRSNFTDYCGACVGYQLKALGVNTTIIAPNGCDAYDTYKSTTTTKGGYKVTAYSESSKSMSELLNSLNGKVSCLNNQYLMLGFQVGYNGVVEGHTLLIYAVQNGYVYYTESFGSSPSYNSKTISSFCSSYSGYTYEGAILFSK
ncbi:MAG: RICIN domain-containing protein [Oscillospiraceae bacterium]|nr:RICIN domain-containing protein [Oscillospiraceae bacterium]